MSNVSWVVWYSQTKHEVLHLVDILTAVPEYNNKYLIQIKMGKELSKKIILLMIGICSPDATLGIKEAVQQFPESMKANVMTESKLAPIMKDLSQSKDIEKLLRQTGNVYGNGTSGEEVPTKQGPCHCSNGLCGCCSRFLFDAWKQKACVNVTYDPDEFSFTTKIWMNDKVLYTRTVSGIPKRM